MAIKVRFDNIFITKRIPVIFHCLYQFFRACTIHSFRVKLCWTRKRNDTIQNELQSFEMELYSYDSDGYCVTIAYSPKCPKFSRR